jgi:hypothetical protein
MRSYEDLASDPGLFLGSPSQRASIRERLYRQYHVALADDLPINPLLDDMLFDSEHDDCSSFNLPLFTTQKEGNAPEPVRARAPSYEAFGNTPPTKHEILKIGGKPNYCMGGYDGGFESGFYGSWNVLIFEYLIDRLSSCRVEGQLTSIEVGGRYFVLRSHGVGGGDSIYYRYVIEGGGWKVYIHHNPVADIQPIRVVFGFESLCGRSLFDVHREFLEWLQKIGFSVSNEIISRVDMQVMTTRPVFEYVNLVAKGWLVKRAKTGSFHIGHSGFSSFEFGSVIRIRCYDKRKQLFDTGSEYALRMIAMYCCGGSLPDNLTRIEFQIKRDALNLYKINTIDDLRNFELSLIEWLTNDWFRLLDSPKKTGHMHEQAMHPIWVEVRDEFRKYFPGGDNNRIITRGDKTGINCTSDDLLAQAIGCLATVASNAGIELQKDSVLDYVCDRISEHADELFLKVQDRAVKNSVLQEGFDPRTAVNLDSISDKNKFFGTLENKE